MLAILAATALLPLYPADVSGTWSYNHRFRTDLYQEKDSGYCVLTSAIDQSSNGIEFRFGITFGDRNEISLATTSNDLSPKELITLVTDLENFDFYEETRDSVYGRTVMRWAMSRSMMSKLLDSLRVASDASITMPLRFADITFPIPTDDSENTFAGAKACQDYRLGRVLSD